jgi:hypothetical protein
MSSEHIESQDVIKTNGSIHAPLEFHLDDVTAQYIRDVAQESEKAQRQAAEQAALPYQNQAQAALQLFIRREKLEGRWRLQPDGLTLRKEE